MPYSTDNRQSNIHTQTLNFLLLPTLHFLYHTAKVYYLTRLLHASYYLICRCRLVLTGMTETSKRSNYGYWNSGNLQLAVFHNSYLLSMKNQMQAEISVNPLYDMLECRLWNKNLVLALLGRKRCQTSFNIKRFISSINTNITAISAELILQHITPILKMLTSVTYLKLTPVVYI